MLVSCKMVGGYFKITIPEFQTLLTLVDYFCNFCIFSKNLGLVFYLVE